MANQHFAALGDVLKHLPLAELLRVDPPTHYWETHAGSMMYALAETGPRSHGAIRFLSRARATDELSRCAYLAALQAFPGLYPGSPALAIQALGRRANYLFCDIDPESARSLCVADSVQVRVEEADGVATIARECDEGQVEPAETLVVIDPFDPHERLAPGSMTPVELAALLARRGYRLFYWYGYEERSQRGWARKEIAQLAPSAELWCGDVLVPAGFVYPDRSGAWGCGVVLANASQDAVRTCGRLGRALERLAADDVAIGNGPPRVTFAVVDG